MKTFEEHEYTAKTTHVVSLQCDLCKKEFKGDSWTRHFGSVEETTLRYKTGYAYPDGGYGEEYEIDVCPECFKDKLLVWFKEQGVEPRMTKWDF